MTEDTNEPYTSLERFVWLVVISVAIVDVALVVASIWSLLLFGACYEL